MADTLHNFERLAGITSDVNSKLQSLRRIIWDDGDDTLFQSLGYALDLWMNTGYICFLYLFNMWILFNVSDPFELLGSVIFFEFLFDLDEAIAASIWWDPDNRFIRAGVIGTVLQETIRPRYMATRNKYIDKKSKVLSSQERAELEKKLDAMGLPNGSDFLTASNDNDTEITLLTVAERVERLRRTESKGALPEQYLERDKPKVFFRGYIFGDFVSDGAVFELHKDLRAWSQWEKL